METEKFLAIIYFILLEINHAVKNFIHFCECSICNMIGNNYGGFFWHCKENRHFSIL